MDQFELLFNQLRRSVAVCHNTFIAAFIPPRFSHRPEDYAPGVRAYCVLSFAALEYYFECVALLLADEAVKRWQKDQSHSDVALRLAFLHPDVKFANDFPKEDRAKETARERLLLASQRFETFVADRNHTISSAVFQKLFWPVGIASVGTELQFISLETLRRERGKHAHNMETNPLAPESAVDLVRDCIELGAAIQEAASQVLYGESKTTEIRKLMRLIRSRLGTTP